jgi:hypothetical protein
MERRGKGAQIWVETVIYTLIGLVIMGLLIGVTTPKIKQMNDKLILGQTMDYVMNVLDQKIIEIRSSPGNERLINLRIKKGELLMDGENNLIWFKILESNYKASEIGLPIARGNMVQLTEENNGKYTINLILNYSSLFNLTVDGKDIKKTYTTSPMDYQVQIQNLGNNQINIMEIS